MAKEIISFRGTKAGLIIVFDDKSNFDDLFSALKKKLNESGYFFVGAPVDLDCGKFDFSKSQFLEIRNLLRDQHGLNISSVRAKSLISQKNARELNWNVIEQEESSSTIKKESKEEKEIPPQVPKVDIIPPPQDEEKKEKGEISTRIFRQSLRSGQYLEYDGSVVILGDVNPGAEVIATGDIIVFGALRGMAFAGADGRTESIILAIRLHPTQIRIADKMARGDESESPDFPEIAAIEDDRIIIEPWNKEFLTNSRR